MEIKKQETIIGFIPKKIVENTTKKSDADKKVASKKSTNKETKKSTKKIK